MTFRVPPRAGKSATAAQFSPTVVRYADMIKAESEEEARDELAAALGNYLARWQAARWQF